MKSGGPWNLRGLRPEARQAARDAARRSGMSVGEWLNGVIETDEPDYGEPMRFADADYDKEYDEDYRPRDDSREPRRPPPRRQRERDYRQERGPAPERDHRREREPAAARNYGREREPAPAPARDAAKARQEFGEVNARLDRLTQQLER